MMSSVADTVTVEEDEGTAGGAKTARNPFPLLLLLLLLPPFRRVRE